MNHNVAVFAGTMVSAFILHGTVANASFRSQSAFNCAVTSADTNEYAPKPDFNPSSTVLQLYNVDTSTGYYLFCPVPNDSTVSTTASTVAATVYGYYNGTSSTCTDNIHTSVFSDQLCRTFEGGSGGSCGAATTHNNGVAGSVADTPAVTSWTASGAHAQDGYFVLVYLGCQVSGTDNVLFSYYVTN